MEYIDELRQQFKEQASEGYWNWDLIEEIKRLHRMFKLGKKIQQLWQTK